MKTILKTLSLMILAYSLSACNTLRDAKEAKGSGSVKLYDQSYNTVWDAAIKVVDKSGLEIASSDKNKGEILAEGAISFFSWGEKVAIFVEKDQNGKVRTRVEVISKRALATNITAKNWEGYIIKNLDIELVK